MKNQKKLIVFLISLALITCTLFCLTACNDNSSDPSAGGQPTVNLSASQIELNEGETAQLIVTGGEKGQTVTYSSQNPEVAEVNKDGTVEAISAGLTTVEVRAGETTLYCTVRVKARLTGILAAFIKSDVSENGKVQLLPNDEFALRVKAQKGDETLKKGAFTVRWETKGSGLSLTADETDPEKATVKAREFGEIQITATVSYLGETVVTDEFTAICREIYLLSNGYENNVITLVTEKTVAGNTPDNYNEVKPNLIYKTVVSETVGVIDSTEMSWKVADESIAKIGENGTVKGLKEGSTQLVGKNDEYGEISMRVDVWNAISSPEDLDALALATYYNDEETARKILSRKYLFTNDIDYSTHTRNFILPIASPAGELYHYYKTTEGVTDCYNLANGSLTWAMHATLKTTAHSGTAVSHYSLTWKALLNLVDATEKTTVTDPKTNETKTVDVHYLKDGEGNEFKGINPRLVPFTGVIDGNGFSVKNAWLMADNFVQKIPNNDGETNTIGAGACFMGINYGTVTNIGFESINIPNRNVTYELKTANGLQTEMKYLQYWHNDSTTNTLNGQYCGLSSGAYVKTNDGAYTTVGWKWNGKEPLSFANAMFTSNFGTISNVYLDYVSCGKVTVWSGRSRADGLVYVNAATVKDCLIVRHDPAAEQLGESFTLSAQDYATTNLVAYDCSTYFVIGFEPKINNVGAYNDTASTKKLTMPTHYENPSDGSGITELYELPELQDNRFVSLRRLTSVKFDPIVSNLNDIDWKELFGFDL